MDIDIKQQVKEILLKENISMTDLVSKLNENKSNDGKTSVSSLNNKLTRGTIKYSEMLEIFDKLNYDIVLQKRPLKIADGQISMEQYSNTINIPKMAVSTLLAGAGGLVGSALFNSAIKSKYGTITGSKEKKQKNIITDDDVIKTAIEFEEKNGYNPIMTDDEIFELNSYQDRLDLEHDFETNIDNLLDIIIKNYDPKIQEYYKEFIETFSGAKNFPLSYKLTTLYRVIYRLLSVQSDSSLRDFITNLRNIYMDGDLIKLTDKELKELYDKSLYYLNIFTNKE